VRNDLNGGPQIVTTPLISDNGFVNPPCGEVVALTGLDSDKTLVMVTFKPRASSSAARAAAEMPLPSDETTPPVTNMKRVMAYVW